MSFSTRAALDIHVRSKSSSAHHFHFSQLKWCNLVIYTQSTSMVKYHYQGKGQNGTTQCTHEESICTRYVHHYMTLTMLMKRRARQAQSQKRWQRILKNRAANQNSEYAALQKKNPKKINSQSKKWYPMHCIWLLLYYFSYWNTGH